MNWNFLWPNSGVWSNYILWGLILAVGEINDKSYVALENWLTDSLVFCYSLNLRMGRKLILFIIDLNWSRDGAALSNKGDGSSLCALEQVCYNTGACDIVVFSTFSLFGAVFSSCNFSSNSILLTFGVPCLLA